MFCIAGVRDFRVVNSIERDIASNENHGLETRSIQEASKYPLLPVLIVTCTNVTDGILLFHMSQYRVTTSLICSLAILLVFLSPVAVL